ncbi:probable phosphoglycerate mutase [Geodermatophilus ruber]|uniref:Probable phosphoglycerate mutase n=2 Tax=Geodermatophilus ruber TaxID=504800 RepID=A0A1I4E6T8_9ACTN|nr:probable phosphoglycerate mutase [Geodermatophilus ruber]
MSRLLIWRHGRTEWNATGRFQGQLDPPLDEEGRRQAARSARHLAAAVGPAEDPVVVSSDLCRAVQTATELTDLLGVPLREDPRLREVGMGSWEGLTRAEVAERYPEQYTDWIAGRPIRGRGGEDPATVPARALAALGDLPDTPVAVVVTHGGTAARLMERLLGLGPEHRRVFGPLANSAWSELALQSGRWRLLRHNVAPHQPVCPGAEGPAAVRPLEAGGSPEEGVPPGSEDADAVL